MGSDISRTIDTAQKPEDLATRPQAERDAIQADLDHVVSLKRQIDNALGAVSKDKSKDIKSVVFEKIIDDGNYRDCRTIATGDYAQVVLATNKRRNDKQVALKVHIIDSQELEEIGVVSLANGLNSPLESALSSSRKIVLKVKHQIYTSDNRHGWICFYEVDFKCLNVKDYFERIHASNKTTMNPALVRNLFRDVAPALLNLHLSFKAQLNLNPSQILYLEDVDRFAYLPENTTNVDESISPFSPIAPGAPALTPAVTPNDFSAPEFATGGQPFNPYKADVFSLGLILLTLTNVAGSDDAEFTSLNRNPEALQKAIAKHSVELEGYIVAGNQLLRGFNLIPNTLAAEKDRIDLVRLCFQHDCIPMKYPLPLVVYKNKVGPNTYHIKYFDGFFYEGPANGNHRDGEFGTLYDQERNAYYRGSWSQDVINGRGMLALNKNVTVEGIFVRGRLSGEFALKYKKPVEVKGTVQCNRVFGAPADLLDIEFGHYVLNDIDVQAGLQSFSRTGPSECIEISLQCSEQGVDTLFAGRTIFLEEFQLDKNPRHHNNKVTVKLQLYDNRKKAFRPVLVHYNEGYGNAHKLFAGIVSPQLVGSATASLKTKLNLDHAGAAGVKLGAEILKWRPYGSITEINLTEAPNSPPLAQLLEPAYSSRLTTLILSNLSAGNGITAINNLASATHLAELKKISLHFGDCDSVTINAALKRLFDSAVGRTVQRLELRGKNINSESLQILSLANQMRALEKLTIADSTQNLEAGLNVLSQASLNDPVKNIKELDLTNLSNLGRGLELMKTGFPNLKSLALSRLSEAALSAENFSLFDSPFASRLEELEFGGDAGNRNPLPIGQAQLDILGRSTQLSNLRTFILHLPINASRQQIITILTKTTKLTKLTLWQDDLTDEALLTDIGKLPFVQNLQSLIFGGRWSTKSAAAFGKWNLKSLKVLELNGHNGQPVAGPNDLILAPISELSLPNLDIFRVDSVLETSPAAAKELFSLSNLPNLSQLELNAPNSIDNDALEKLAGRTGLPRFRQLRIHGANVEDEAFNYFIDNATLSNIDYLEITCPKVSDHSVQRARGKWRVFKMGTKHIGKNARRLLSDGNAADPIALSSYKPEGINSNTISRILKSKPSGHTATEISLEGATFDNSNVLARVIQRLSTETVTILRLKDISLLNHDPTDQQFQLFRDVASNGRLKNLREISISNFPYEEQLLTLFEKLNLQQITRFEIENTGLKIGTRPDDIGSLLQRPTFANLTELTISQNKNINLQVVVRGLNTFQWARTLKSLSLKNAGIDTQALQTMFAAGFGARVSMGSPGGVQQPSGPFALLEELDLSNNKIDEAGASYLAARDALPSLRVLVVRGTLLTDAQKQVLRNVHNILII